jgi:hypothetical protein
MNDRFIASESGVSIALHMRNTANTKRAILETNSTASFMAIPRDIFTLAVNCQPPKKS